MVFVTHSFVLALRCLFEHVSSQRWHPSSHPYFVVLPRRSAAVRAEDVTNVTDFWDQRLREHLEKQKGWVNEDPTGTGRVGREVGFGFGLGCAFSHHGGGLLFWGLEVHMFWS